MNKQEGTASIVIIGDEILSGRVKDENSPFLIKQLTKQGVQIRVCVTIPDNISVISDTIFECHKKYQWVFTSGGIGPTHDDITMEGIAEAFKVKLIQNEELVTLIKSVYGKKFRKEHLKMAVVPKGTQLLYSENNRFPALTFDNLIILPGVPEFLKAIYISIRSHFQGKKIFSKVIKVPLEEVEIAGFLNEALLKYPELKIGSYPVFRKKEYLVKLVLQHENMEVLLNGETFLKQKFKKL